MNGELASERRRFAWLLAASCLLLTAPRLALHELWRDEAWLWLVAIESHGLDDLLRPLARSGQGYLFPLLCFVARQVSTAPQAMQLLHLALASAACFVLARWAPFDRTTLALLTLGYFPLYEYAVISRHYALGSLLLWLACAAAQSRRPALGLGAAIGLLCQTTVYGFILALAVAAGWLCDRLLRRREVLPIAPRPALAGLALALAGAGAGLVQLIPQSGTSFAASWRLGWEPAVALTTLQMPWRAFVPLPRFELHFWNSNLLDPWPAWQAIGGLLVLALAIALLWRRRAALVTFGLGALGLLAFGYLKFFGEVRHHGHWWLLFIAALWMGGGIAREDSRRSWRSQLFLALLIVHGAAMAFASWMDLRHPFSNGARAAELIQSSGLGRFPLLGYREPPAASVALALGRPLYAPSRGVYATRPDWGPRQRDLSIVELRCAARDLARRERQDVILVMNQELPPWRELDAAGSRRGAIVGDEDYFLYRLRLDRLATTAKEAACLQAG